MKAGSLLSMLVASAALLALAPAAGAVGGLPTKGHWHPAPGTAAWQWQLQGKLQLTAGASVYDIDGFESTVGDVRAIHRHRHKAICYLDVGSWEEYRPDAGQFPRSVLGKRYEGFPEERWLDIAHFHKFAGIMEKRIEMCARKRFDAVEPDNLAGWENKTGFPLTRADQLRYNRWIARQVHRRGMAVALKNDPKQVKQLVGDFDFAIVEECFQFRECGYFKPFVETGKAVFEAEYELPTSGFCPRAEALDFSAIRKNVELFARPWEPCDPLPDSLAAHVQGGLDGIRPVPRAAGGAAGRDAHLRPALRVAGRGVPGDRLVPATPRGRARRRREGNHARRPGGGVQALLDGPRVPAPQNAALARDRRRGALPDR